MLRKAVISGRQWRHAMMGCKASLLMLCLCLNLTSAPLVRPAAYM
jgi:hypothetical protein